VKDPTGPAVFTIDLLETVFQEDLPVLFPEGKPITRFNGDNYKVCALKRLFS